VDALVTRVLREYDARIAPERALAEQLGEAEFNTPCE
jgi:hypothetical protein